MKNAALAVWHAGASSAVRPRDKAGHAGTRWQRKTLWTKAAQPGTCPQKTGPATTCPLSRHTRRGVRCTCIAAAQGVAAKDKKAVAHRKGQHLLRLLCIHRSLKGTTRGQAKAAPGQRAVLCPKAGKTRFPKGPQPVRASTRARTAPMRLRDPFFCQGLLVAHGSGKTCVQPGRYTLVHAGTRWYAPGQAGAGWCCQGMRHAALARVPPFLEAAAQAAAAHLMCKKHGSGSRRAGHRPLQAPKLFALSLLR